MRQPRVADPSDFDAHAFPLGPVWVNDLMNTLGKTGMAVGAFVAVVLNNTVPATRLERGLPHVVGEDEPPHTPQALAPEIEDEDEDDEDQAGEA